ncbi:MAG: 50S ribosome-binding GTPase [Candidatus Shikimatogenerans sp. JK-2022]|nr:50S ribosome-binding GTPase [Candidatus Shikimatogenerans bostrichidophilus]
MNKIITIIGKTNVGKSTFFNLLIKKNRSIVSKEENTTLNINNGILKIKKYKYTLRDTAGYKGDFLKKDKLYKKVINQIYLSIKESNLILLIVDIIQGINYLDKELYLIIKKYKKDFFLLINKIDIKNKITNIYNILNLNFKVKNENIYYISSTHKIGINLLLKNINILLTKNKIKVESRKDNINVSILGVPNSGKSTFINSYFLENNKSIVNNLGGTTRDTLYFKKKFKKYEYTLIDTPGIIKNFKYKKYKRIFLLKVKKIIKESDICIIIIDIYLGLNSNDNFIIKEILKYKKGIIIIFNKCDLLDEKYINILKGKYINFFKDYIPIFFLSLKYNFKNKDILFFNKLILNLYKNRSYKITTSRINNILLKNINKKNLKINNKIFKIKFCYQSKKKKFPYFIINSNLIKNINITLKKNIENIIRKYIFNFYGTPIELIFKKNKNVKNIFYKKK